MSGIGVMREGPLHAAIKDAIAQPGDAREVSLGRFVIDLVRADGELVEIQTGGFAPLARKLDALLDTHRIRIVHPVAAERRIVRVGADGEVLSVRRSPRRGTVLDVFDRLVSFPSLLSHPNLVLEVLLLTEDHLRGPEPVRVRRRTRDPGERRMRAVLGRVELRGPGELLGLLIGAAPGLADVDGFTTRELATSAGCGIVLAQRIAFCLRAVGLIEPAGFRRRAPVYRFADGAGIGASSFARAGVVAGPGPQARDPLLSRPVSHASVAASPSA